MATLPAALREMADLRLNFPYMNLAELGEVAGGLSRSAVNHRLRRLLEAAERQYDVNPGRIRVLPQRT